jgi:hypothetical protein
MVDWTTLVHIPQSLLATLPKLPTNLYPLPLTAFEKYLFWDETPQQPMSFFVELHFLDPLQTRVMEEAIAAAMHIHPMFVCTIDECGGKLCWIHHADFRHQLVPEAERPPLIDGRPIPIDLRREPSIRFWYSQDSQGRSRVLIQQHHAAADGVGMRRLLIDVLTFYARATAPEKVDTSLKSLWSKVDLELLKRRADFSDSFGCPPTQPLTTWQRLKNARFFHFQLPKPLRGSLRHRANASSLTDSVHHNSGENAANDLAAIATGHRGQAELFEPLQHLEFDPATSEAIMEKSRKAEISINELSLALLFETCSLWNQQRGDRNPNSRLRLLMPYDLRSRIDLRMPAANRLSFSFIGRTQADCRDLTGLVRSIGDEIQAMRGSQLPLDFLAALEGASKYPGLMRWALKRSRNMATAVLTYVGDVSRGMQKYFPEEEGIRIVGDARLDKILAAPPTRDNTHISIGLCINWGRLCVSAAWNRDGLTRQQCQEFLQLYYSRWQMWLR